MAVSLSVNPIDANKDINAGATNGITISGTSSDSILANLVGQSIVFNGKTCTGRICRDDMWSVNVEHDQSFGTGQRQDLHGDRECQDLVGKKPSSADKAVVDKTSTLAVAAVDGNGSINAKNAAERNDPDQRRDEPRSLPGRRWGGALARPFLSLSPASDRSRERSCKPAVWH